MAAAELGQLKPQRPAAISCADPVERARALIPLLEAAGPAIEQAGELTPEVLEALRANDFFRLLTARAIGGQALPLPVFAEIVEALAIGDPSTAALRGPETLSRAVEDTVAFGQFDIREVLLVIPGEQRGALHVDGDEIQPVARCGVFGGGQRRLARRADRRDDPDRTRHRAPACPRAARARPPGIRLPGPCPW